MSNEKKRLTAVFGIPPGDDRNYISAGVRGPVLMQGVHLLEKLTDFDSARIPKCIVYVKRTGPYCSRAYEGVLTPSPECVMSALGQCVNSRQIILHET